MKAGQQAELASDYDRAVVEYTRALKDDPDNRDAHLALNRAKLRAAEMHFNRARRLAATGKYEEAVIEYELAHELNPTSSDVDTELRKARLAVRNKIAVPADGKTQLEALVERTRDMPNSSYELPRDAKLPASLLFREASSRDVITTLARVANLNVIFDPSFRESPVTTELHDATFEDALTSITSSTHNFYQGHRPAHHHHRSGHARQATGVRGRGRPDVLPEQRRPQGNDRPAPHRHRPAADRGRPRRERASRSRTRRTA